MSTIYKAFWEEALRQIQDTYVGEGREDEYTLWFGRMNYVEDTISTITVSVPSKFLWDQMVSQGLLSSIEDKLAEITGQNITIQSSFSTAPANTETRTASAQQTVSSPRQAMENMLSSLAQEAKEQEESASANAKAIPQEARERYEQVVSEEPHSQSPKADGSKRKTSELNEDFTFESFVPGDNSMFAYNTCFAAAKSPGTAYNPILLYGGVGLGKTHLMEAVGNLIQKNSSGNLKILYTQAEPFTNEFTASLKNKTTEAFKEKYRKLDVLLIDDIQFLEGKDKTQEELFYTFEALYNAHKQMVFTCDRPIDELKDITERLRSRFALGMNIDLKPPTYETRLAILQKNLEATGRSVPQDVLEYIAKNVQTNVRQLLSCLKTVTGYIDVIHSIDLEHAKDILHNQINTPGNGSFNIDTIQRVVAEHYNISLADMKSKKRNKKFVIPRQIAVYIARETLDYSFPELGTEFGGKDHTTMMHSYEKIVEQRKMDSSLDSTIQILIREIREYKK